MPGRDVVVVEPDGGVGAAADQDRRLVEVGALADVRALDDEDVGGAAAALGRLLALPWRASTGPRRPAARAPSGTRAPNMSERITEIADSTKIQRIAR